MSGTIQIEILIIESESLSRQGHTVESYELTKVIHQLMSGREQYLSSTPQTNGIDSIDTFFKNMEGVLNQAIENPTLQKFPRVSSVLTNFINGVKEIFGIKSDAIDTFKSLKDRMKAIKQGSDSNKVNHDTMESAKHKGPTGMK